MKNKLSGRQKLLNYLAYHRNIRISDARLRQVSKVRDLSAAVYKLRLAGHIIDTERTPKGTFYRLVNIAPGVVLSGATHNPNLRRYCLLDKASKPAKCYARCVDDLGETPYPTYLKGSVPCQMWATPDAVKVTRTPWGGTIRQLHWWETLTAEQGVVLGSLIALIGIALFWYFH